jgi:hypothetical protein
MEKVCKVRRHEQNDPPLNPNQPTSTVQKNIIKYSFNTLQKKGTDINTQMLDLK